MFQIKAAEIAFTPFSTCYFDILVYSYQTQSVSCFYRVQSSTDASPVSFDNL